MNPLDDFDPTKFGFPPPLTRKQGLARWAADRELFEHYPNQYVAFIDSWYGEELDRRVIGTARTLAEYSSMMQGFDAEVRKRVTVRRVPEPDVVSSPSAFLG